MKNISKKEQKVVTEMVRNKSVDFPYFWMTDKYTTYIDFVHDVHFDVVYDEEVIRLLKSFSFYRTVVINRKTVGLSNKSIKYISFDLFDESVCIPFSDDMLFTYNDVFTESFDENIVDNEIVICNKDKNKKLALFASGDSAIVISLHSNTYTNKFYVMSPKVFMKKSGRYLFLSHKQAVCLFEQLKGNKQVNEMYAYYKMLFTDIEKMTVKQDKMFHKLFGAKYVNMANTKVIDHDDISVRIRTPIGYYRGYHSHGENDIAMFKIKMSKDYEYYRYCTVIENVLYNAINGHDEEKEYKKLCKRKNIVRFRFDCGEVFVASKSEIYYFIYTPFGIMDFSEFYSDNEEDEDFIYSNVARLNKLYDKYILTAMKLTGKTLDEILEGERNVSA